MSASEVSVRTCTKCRLEKETSQFSTLNSGALHSWCVDCVKAKNRASYLKHRDARLANQKQYTATRKAEIREQQHNDRRRRVNVHLWKEARKRARQKGLKFTITPDHIVVPSTCPALGIPLIVGEGKLWDFSPTLDRLDPSRGYEPDNIAVISYRANRMKSSGSASELILIAAWMLAKGRFT